MPEYVLLGISRIDAPGTFSFAADIGEDFVLEYKSTQSQIGFAFTYVSVGVPPRAVCSACS